MAVTHDANVRFPATDTTGFDTTTGNRSFTHTSGASAKGAVVALFSTGTVATVTGVTYAALPMSLVVTAVDTTEAGRVDLYALVDEASFPTGAQAVILQGCTNTQKWATCSTMTANLARVKVNASGNVNTTVSANPSITIVTSATTLLYGGVHGGAAAPTDYAVGTGYTSQHSADYGALSARSSRRTTQVSAGSIVYDFVFATSDDWCIAAVALEEYTPSAVSPLVELLMAPKSAP